MAIFDRSREFLHLLVYVLKHRDDAEIEVVAAAIDIEILLAHTAIDPAVILFGLSVPNLVDPQVLARLRARWPQACVVVLSWLDQEEYHTLALEVGTDAVIPKTQLDTALVPTILRLGRDKS